jgi:hypothetical protein
LEPAQPNCDTNSGTVSPFSKKKLEPAQPNCDTNSGTVSPFSTKKLKPAQPNCDASRSKACYLLESDQVVISIINYPLRCYFVDELSIVSCFVRGKSFQTNRLIL